MDGQECPSPHELILFLSGLINVNLDEDGRHFSIVRDRIRAERIFPVPELRRVECAADAISNLWEHLLRGPARVELDLDHLRCWSHPD